MLSRRKVHALPNRSSRRLDDFDAIKVFHEFGLYRDDVWLRNRLSVTNSNAAQQMAPLTLMPECPFEALPVLIPELFSPQLIGTFP